MQQSTIRSLVRRTGSLVHNRTVPAVLRSSFPRYSSTETVTSTSANSPPPPVGVNDPKLNKLVDDISALTLLQAADFVSLLKTRLNITEIALPAASASAGPAAAAAPAEEEAAPPEEKPKEKTMFTLRLESFDAAAKAKVIREVKATFANMNLMEAKKFAESVPQTLKENVPKEEAEKLKAAFEALGAKVIVE